MNIKKTMFSLLLVFAFMLNALPPFNFLFQPITVSAFSADEYYKTMVYADDPISTSTINYNGSSIGPGAYIIVDGVRYPVFCVDPNLPGADYHPNGQYPINIGGTNMSAKVATVLHNSVPYVTKESILARFPGLTDHQIYAATKAAVRAVADQSASRYPDDDLWGGDPQTVAFAKYLINLAKNNPEDVPKSALHGITNTVDSEDEDYFIRATTIQSSNYPLAPGTKIKLIIPDDAPAGTYITLEDGSPIPANGVDNRTRIEIRVPKASIPPETSGSFDVTAEMTIFSNVILFGEPVNTADKGKYQRYEVSMPNQPVGSIIPVPYSAPPPDDEVEGFGGLQILKYDNVTGNLTAGAVFEVKGIDGNNSAIRFQVQASAGAAVPSVDNGAVVTAGNGTVSVEGIPVGKYQITELTAPPNYDMTPDGINSQVVEVQSSEIATVYPQVMFRNNPYGKLKVTKIDAVTGQTVAGTTLRIRNEVAGIDITRTTDGSGVITLEDLPQGNYSVTEVNAGEDYELNPATVVVPVRWGQLAEAVFDNQPHTSFEVTKINSKTNQPVAGAVFTLKQLSTGKEWTLTTLVGGKAVVSNIPAGNYTLKEIFVPEPLILNGKVVNIQINNDKINSYTAVNDEKPVVTLEKYDEKTSQLIGGAEFRLEKLDGAWQSEFMVDSTGKKTITVTSGTYRFTEIAAPDGYLITTKHKDFVLNPNDEITIKFDNRPCPKLEIKKIDTLTGEPLAGARFKVIKTEDLTVSEYITDAGGTILIENLDEAIYTVEEIIAPDGYILNPQKKEIKLEWGKTKTLIYEDIRKPTLIITKSNALTFVPIPNTTYKVEYEDANGGVRTLGTYRTDENGQIILPKVEAGWYIITETIAAPGYSLAANPVTRKYLAPGENAYTNTAVSGTGGDISGDNIMVMSGSEFLLGQEILDYPLNSIVIRKVNSVTGELLAGARFQVRKVTEETSGSGGTVIGEYTTDNSGVIVLTGLVPGGYVIEEVKAPANYLLSENSQQQVWLKYDGTSIVESTFANVPYDAILITKVDAQTNKPLANARFRVTDGSGAVVGNTNGEYITDENGEVLVVNVKPGSYVVTEIEAPANYVADTTPQTVNVGIDGKTYKVSFKNQPAGTLILRKLDTVTKEPLADAEFKVTTSGGDVVGTSNGIFKTDATGTITIPHLPKGSYIVQEIKAPTDYILENQSQTIAVDYGKTYTLDFYNKHMSGLQIIKIDSVTKQPLKGAEFAVYKQNGELFGRYTTDADGVIIVNTLEPGWYKAVETKTLDGYLLDDVPQDFQITANQFVKLVFENAPMSSLIIRKVDADTRQPLKGAEFTVKTMAGGLIGNYVSDEDGLVTVPALMPGWYTVTETVAPVGYSLGDNVQNVEITNSKTVTIEFRNLQFGSLVIKKTDEFSGVPIAGAQFTVSHQNGAFMGEYVTGNDGTIAIPDVEPGWYVISENRAPSGYQLDNTARTVEVKPVVPTVTTFTNKPLTAIEIVKVDSVTRNPLANATFKVERPNGEVVGTYKTDVSGKALVSGLTEGTYIISETIAPDGYHLNETPKTVVVTANKVTVVEFSNKPFSGIQILKTDANTNAPLQGAIFTIQRVNGERVGDKYTTDISGKIIVYDLPEGVYIISEIQAPAEYVLDAQPQTVEVKSGRLTLAEFVNTPFPYLHILKTDASTGELLSGAEFIVTDSKGGIIANVVSQSTGAVSLKVEPGVYTVTEVKAPAGYELNDPVQTVEVRANGTSVYYGTNTVYPNNTASFANKPFNAVEIVKLDAITNNPLSNAVFTITKSNGDSIGSFRTDNSGSILVTGLSGGTYIIKEISAPDGYILDEIPQTVNISGGRLVPVMFLNKPLSGIQITKLDAVDGKPLGGASFRVAKANGEIVGTFRTESDGMAVVPNLDEGTYTVSEINAPNGYQLDEKPKTVNVVSGRLATVEFTNKPYSGIQILKTDAVTHAPLVNATFTVDRSNGERIGVYRTDAAGQILIPELAEGTYIVAESAAPNGYQLDNTPKTVTVVSGRVTVIEFTNKPLSGIQITKLDAVDGKPLGGASFSVTKANGEQIGTFRTESDGQVIVPNLDEGVYVIGEISAPNGYQLDNTPKNVTVVSGRLATVEFFNKPYSGIQILKTDAVTQVPLANATFTVDRSNGERIGVYKTDAAGQILIPDLAEGTYIVAESATPNGYTLDNTPKTVTVVSGRVTVIEFTNEPYGSLVIRKTDEIDGRPLAGAVFTVKHQGGSDAGEFITGSDGSITVPNLKPGWYIVSEIKAPNGYHLDSTAKTIEVKPHTPTQITFTNRAYSGIQITKLDANNRQPLQGAEFSVTKANGERVGTFRTEADGKVLIPDLAEGVYVVGEISAPNGYQLDEAPKNVTVTSGRLATVEFTNKKFSGIQIVKTNAVTNAPLAGATFKVTKSNGEVIGTYKTDNAGHIIVPDLAEGMYVVAETIAPDGFMLDETPKNVIVTSGKLATIEFTNKPHSGIEILKLDVINKTPLMGATFVVERDNGERIGTYRTDWTGKIIVHDLSDGTYIVSEIIAPNGYQLDEAPKTVIVKSGKLTVVEFTNKRLSGIEIIKLDAQTNAPLSGATFIVERDNGEKIGTYKTDSTGKIIVPDLTEGTYIVSETIAPDGYILDEAPKTVIVKSGKLTVTEFLNKPLAGLKIIKLNSVTRNPIEGVEFEITKMNGEKVENDFRGYNFKTDKIGQIYIPKLADGYYTITETRTVDGYILDGEPKTVLIQSGKTTVLEVLNTPVSGLLIVKTDAVTGRPIPGAVFDIKRADGQFVAGSIADGNQPNTANNSPNKSTSPNGDITGSYTTDANGRILINGLAAGQYNVTERKAPEGYELDTQVYNVTVLPGQLATLQLQNTPLGGIRLTKIDSLSKKPIFGVEFMLFDMSGKVVGVYYTDNNGRIDFPTNIAAGRYTIRETRAAQGYYLDDMPKTIEFVPGKITEITWENTPQMGQIQITKRSGDDNQVNGLPKGSPLANAVFEVYDYKTGNLIDRFISGSDGRAVSKPLPLGRYLVKEVKAPDWYKLSDKELDITIEFATQIIKHEFLNYSANTGVTIRKTGNVEAMLGDVIRYDIKEVQNNSSVPLTDFFWRDTLPTNAVRLNKIITGTYNQSLRYKVMITTNKSNTRVIADNLSTTQNNVIDCSNAALGLASDEYVTSFTLMFGTVKAGFAAVEKPQVYVKVLSNLPNGFEFANKADIGGKYLGEWVIGNAVWTTKTYTPSSKYPRTGY